MARLLKLEELAQFVLALVAFLHLGNPFWLFALLILLPDLGMIGYAGGPKLGAYIYNLAHHKTIAIALGLLGLALSNNALVLAGLIIYAHSSMDRALGFGLKQLSSFQDTHLGKIGKQVLQDIYSISCYNGGGSALFLGRSRAKL